MKFYKRFPGDIQIKTGGLSLAEFGAYDRLLDHYYAMEQPIEAAEVYSITRALTKTDRDAVDKVLRRYFKTDEKGNYIQERAAEMIAEAQPKIEAARANGKKGGRPKKPYEEKPTGFISETETETKTGDFPKTSQSQTSSLRSEEIQEPTVLVGSPSGDPPPAKVVPIADRRIPCPAERLLEVFHECCPTLPRVMKLNDNRRKHLTARWREVDADSKFANVDDGITVFRGIFQKVHDSDFLAGRAKAWHATFDWLTESSTNFLKVCEGHYDNDARAKK